VEKEFVGAGSNLEEMERVGILTVGIVSSNYPRKKRSKDSGGLLMSRDKLRYLHRNKLPACFCRAGERASG